MRRSIVTRAFFASFLALVTLNSLAFAQVVVPPVVKETLDETRRLIDSRPDVKRQVEALDRGLVCVATPDGVYCSWRQLGTESYDVQFALYRDDQRVDACPSNVTNYLDPQGTIDSSYRVETTFQGETLDVSKTVRPLERPYVEIKTTRPDDWQNDREPNARPMRYQLGNMSTGDLDGDGEYELVVLWESNSRDNAHNGYSAPLCVAAYKLDGTRLWEFECGVNVRTGAHYNPILVADFDLDGKSEVALKTAPGAKDASERFVSQASRDAKILDCDDSADYRNPSGRILDGPEFLTIFDGPTGVALDTVDYWPERGPNTKRNWGDDYGNRVDRFLAAVAYLDAQTPHAVFARGYYARTTLAAYVLRDKKLERVATFDSHDSTRPENARYEGRGNHSLAVADVDFDGKDEIIYGAALFDHDLTGVYPQAPSEFKIYHGDAHHLGDLVPERPGLELFSVHESGDLAFDMRDARTGELIFFLPSIGKDVGRGAADDVDPRTPGAESWAAGKFVAPDGSEKNPAPRLPVNFFCYWDGDLGREIQDGTSIFKFDPDSGRAEKIFNADDCVSYGGSKATPFLNADLFGDWREETIYALRDGSGFRVYTTTIPTKYRLATLMHDPVYRLAVAWQNAGYNQPPHVGFPLGFDLKETPVLPVFAIDPQGKRCESPDKTPRPL